MGALVYDTTTHRTLVFGARRVWSYDVRHDRWSQSMGPVDASLYGKQAVFDPVTASWIVRDPGTARMWTYRADTGTWRMIRQGDTVPLRGGSFADPRAMRCLAQFLAYDPSVDRVVLYLGYCFAGDPSVMSSSTWEFDPRAGTWSETPFDTPELMYGYLPDPRFTFSTYDEENGRMVIRSWRTLTAYDAVAGEWETGVSVRAGYGSVVYDPVNRRLVLYGEQGGSGDVWAAETEMQLLAPTERS
jgi:hypothetical protein